MEAFQAGVQVSHQRYQPITARRQAEQRPNSLALIDASMVYLARPPYRLNKLRPGTYAESPPAILDGSDPALVRYDAEWTIQQIVIN